MKIGNVEIQPPVKMAAKSNGASAGTNPRKVGTGSSYNASGVVQPPNLGPETGSGRSSPVIEIVPELTSPFQRTQVYARMMNDAGVDASTRVWKTPALGAEYYIDPYSDDPNDVLVSDFIAGNLFDGMSSPFSNSLEDILHFCEDGYSILKKVYEQREWAPRTPGANSKTYTMLKKLGVRPPQTIKQIVYDDNGGPSQVVQAAIKSDGTLEDVTFDISELMVFTLNRKGGDLTGKSMLRTAYPHWYYKTHLYKIDAIQKERHSLGVPKGKLLPGYNEADKKILRQLLANLRTNEEAFMLLTPNVDVEFAQIHGQLVNVLESATHHNMMIFMNVLAQFLVLGSGTGSGARATAASQSDIFMKSLIHIANYICEVFNMYLIPELVVWNFKTTNFPQLKVRNIGDTKDLQMLASALSNLFSQSALTQDLDTENWIRRVFNMPAKQANAISTLVTAPTDTATSTKGASKGGVANQRDKVGSNVGKGPTQAN